MDYSYLAKDKIPIKRYFIILCGDEKIGSKLIKTKIAVDAQIPMESTVFMKIDNAMKSDKEKLKEVKKETDFDELRKQTYWQLYKSAKDFIHQGFNVVWPNEYMAKTLKLLECARKLGYIALFVDPDWTEDMKKDEIFRDHIKQSELLTELVDITYAYDVTNENEIKQIFKFQKRFTTHCDSALKKTVTCDMEKLRKYADQIQSKFGKELIQLCDNTLKNEEETEIKPASEINDLKENVNEIKTSVENVKEEFTETVDNLKTEVESEVKNLEDMSSKLSEKVDELAK